MLSTSMSMSYMLCLCIEVVLKLRMQTITHYKFRRIVYHLFSIGFAVFLVVLALCLGEFGSSRIKTCTLAHGSITHHIRLASFAFDIAAMWILMAFIVGKVGKTYSNVIYNYYLVILSVSICVTITNILNNIELFGGNNQEGFADCAGIIAASTGIWIGISRLYNKRLVRHVLWKLGFKHRNTPALEKSEVTIQSDSLLNENIYNLGDLFENLSKKIALQILSVISLRFGNCNDKLFSIENEADYDQYEFDKELFDGVGDLSEMGKINESDAYVVYSPDLYLIEYKPMVFQAIRDICNISRDNLLE